MPKIYLHHLNLYQEAEQNFVPAAVVIAAGTICAFGDIPVPADADQVIDCGGGYLMPGFIDCHTHLSLDCTLTDYLERMNGSREALTEIALDTLRRDLYSGVTAQRCMGDRFYIDTQMKQAVARGDVVGPRLFVSGIGMRSPKGFGYVGMPVEGDDILKTIRQNVDEGADWIKFYETATTLQDGVAVAYYDEAEIGTMIRAAHALGKPVTSHCIGGEGLKASIRQGIDCIEHAYFITEDEIRLMQDAGTWFCMTAGEYFTDKENAPAAYQEKLRQNRARVSESMGNILASSIPFVLGTDGIHARLYEEAQYAAFFGASKAAVLRAITSNAAKLLGAEKEIGRIQKGYRADLVLLDGNPFVDLGALSQIQQVYQAGNPVL